MTNPTPPPILLDSLLPPEMAKKAENIGVSKANLGPVSYTHLVFH